MKVTVSDSMQVSTVTAFGSKNKFGNFAKSFELITSGHSISGRFIMGAEMKVDINWSLRLLDSLRLGLYMKNFAWSFETFSSYYVHIESLESFRIQNCAVTHGDVSVDIIKSGCFASLLKVKPLAGSNHSQSFSFQVFKGSDIDATAQELSCHVTICEKQNCFSPKNNAHCSSEFGDNVFKYSFDGSWNQGMEVTVSLNSDIKNDSSFFTFETSLFFVSLGLPWLVKNVK